MAETGEKIPTVPARVIGFSKYLNNYVAALAVAVIPIPLANWNWVPIWDAQRHLLSVVTPVFCFLTMGFLFFYRHALAGPMFPGHARRGELMDVMQPNRKLGYVLSQTWDRAVSLVPLVLIVGSFFCAGQYYLHLIASINDIARDAQPRLQFQEIPDGGSLIMFFVLAFVFAEAAFVWMALKEYLQDTLKLTDTDLIARQALEFRKEN